MRLEILAGAVMLAGHVAIARAIWQTLIVESDEWKAGKPVPWIGVAGVCLWPLALPVVFAYGLLYETPIAAFKRVRLACRNARSFLRENRRRHALARAKQEPAPREGAYR